METNALLWPCALCSGSFRVKDQVQIATRASQSLLRVAKRCSLPMAFCPFHISKYISPFVQVSVHILHFKSQNVGTQQV